MSVRTVTELALWCATIFVAALLAAGLRPPGEAEIKQSRVAAMSSGAIAILAADSVAAASDYLSANDPFRVSHQPSSVPFGAATPVLAQGLSRPTLALRGIVGSSGGWSAVLTGIPGHDGTVLLRAGDTIAGLRVRRVAAGSAVIQGRDTLWTLSLEVPWH